MVTARMLVLLALITGCVTGDDVITRAVDPADVYDGTAGTFVDGAWRLGAGGRGLSISVAAHPGEVLTAIEFDAIVYGGDLYSYAYRFDYSHPPNVWDLVADPVYGSGHVVRAFDREPEVIAIVPHNVTGQTYRGGTISRIRLVLRYD